MAYSSKFVLSVLLDGQRLIERNDGIISIPLESEYALRFRNKHDRRAVVQFTIDGEDVSGPGYIIPAHSSIDILRHYHRDVRFKFVSLTSDEAADFGKNDGNEDGSKGVIEARFFLEKKPDPKPIHIHHHHDHYHPKPYYPPYPPVWPYIKPYPVWSTGGDHRMLRSHSSSSSSSPSSSYSAAGGQSLGGNTMELCGLSKSCSDDAMPMLNDTNIGSPKKKELIEGCTVEGAASGQRFTTQHIDLETDFVPLRVVLRGFKSDKPIQVISESKSHCTQCGAKRSRKSDKFCGGCGQKF